MPDLGPIEIVIILITIAVLLALLAGAALVLRALVRRPRPSDGAGHASRLAELEARVARLEGRG